jgi:hypothetical protein
MIAAFNEGGKKHERSTAGQNRKKNKKEEIPKCSLLGFAERLLIWEEN